MIVVLIKNRILLSNGNYTVYISDGHIKEIFERRRVAKSTFLAMKKANVPCKYDDDRTIEQELMGSEEEILESIKEELESAIKNHLPTQKLSYEVIKEVE